MPIPVRPCPPFRQLHHLTQWPLVLGALCYSAAALWFGLTLRHTPLPEETGSHAATPAVADAADASIAR